MPKEFKWTKTVPLQKITRKVKVAKLSKQQTLVLIKPDGVERNLIGEIISRLETKGYKVADLKMLSATNEMLAEHYAEHLGKPFYEPLIAFMSSGPIVAIKLEGDRVIEGFRSLAGATDPTAALPGTIRGDLGRDWGEKVQKNLVHGSDSPESAARELGIWFS
jgi:nucleoside-diphosphate kinase